MPDTDLSYLADRRLDMLPAVLSEQVCSLRQHQDRFAFSVFWEFDKTTKEILRTWFARVVIRSAAELHYKLAQDIFDDKPPAADRRRLTDYDGIRTDIIQLVHLARVLRERRLARGAIELESQQLKFEVNTSTKEPTKIIPKEEYEVNRAVAEWMILANEAVGKRIWQSCVYAHLAAECLSASLSLLMQLTQVSDVFAAPPPPTAEAVALCQSDQVRGGAWFHYRHQLQPETLSVARRGRCS